MRTRLRLVEMTLFLLSVSACGITTTDEPPIPPECEKDELRMEAADCERQTRRVERCEDGAWKAISGCLKAEECSAETPVETDALCGKATFNKLWVKCDHDKVESARCTCGAAEPRDFGRLFKIESEEQAAALKGITYVSFVTFGDAVRKLRSAGLPDLICADELQFENSLVPPEFPSLAAAGTVTLAFPEPSSGGIPDLSSLRYADTVRVDMPSPKWPTPVRDLSTFRGLEEVGSLRAHDVASIEGLQSLRNARSIDLSECFDLESLEPLSALREVKGRLVLPPFVSPKGLENLEHVGSMTVWMETPEDLRTFDRLQTAEKGIYVQTDGGASQAPFPCEISSYFEAKGLNAAVDPACEN